jgi:hypothetical protein
MESITMLKFPNKRNTQLFRICGDIIMVLSFGLLFDYFYGVFFDRKDYYNRKYLREYLEKNPDALGEPYNNNPVFSHWKIDDYEITYNHHGDKWYIFIYSTNYCFMSSFISDKRDRKNYEAIKQILIDSIDKHKQS